MTFGPSYTYRRIHFTRGNALFVRYLSVCLSVCRISFVDSELERHRKFTFYGEVTDYTSNYTSDYTSNYTSNYTSEW